MKYERFRLVRKYNTVTYCMKVLPYTCVTIGVYMQVGHGLENT